MNVIFDFDGPLNNLVQALISFFMQERGFESRAAVARDQNSRSSRRWVDPDLPSDVKKEQWSRLKEEIRQFNDDLLRHNPEVRRGLVEQLNHKQDCHGWRFGIVTNGMPHYVEKLLEGVQHPFDPILTFADHWDKSDRIRKVVTTWGAQFEDVLFITDTVGDIVEAKEVLPADNIIGIPWGFQLAQTLEETGVYVLDTQKEEHLIQHLEMIEVERFRGGVLV